MTAVHTWNADAPTTMNAAASFPECIPPEPITVKSGSSSAMWAVQARLMGTCHGPP